MWMYIYVCKCMNIDVYTNTHTTHTHTHTQHTRIGLDCQQDVEALIAIDNAHLVLASPSGTGKRILWAGIIYRSDVEQPFQAFMCVCVCVCVCVRVCVCVCKFTHTNTHTHTQYKSGVK
jgi:hypothetical protein